MPLSVEPVRDRRSFRAFLKLPWKIYRNNPNWVPPILRQVAFQFDRRRAPFHRHGEVESFIAWQGTSPVGRITAILNRTHLEAQDDGLGFFGFLEMEKDLSIGRALLRAAADWLGERGLRRMLGPVQFTTNDTCGILVEGFDTPPVILMPYNPPYYGTFLEALGLESPRLLFAYEITREVVLTERIRRVADRAERRGIRIREVDLGDFDAEVERVREIYNAALGENWGFQRMTRDEFFETARDLRRGADRRLLLMAEADGEPVGCVISLPDLNRALRLLNGRMTPWGILRMLLAARKIKRIRTLILGVKREYRRRGVDALLIRETVERGLRAGYDWAELSWVLEDNDLMNRAIREMGGRVYKGYRLYEGDLEAVGRAAGSPR